MAYPKKIIPKYLNKKELENLYAIMRHWCDPYRMNVAKIIKHIAALQTHIDQLNEEITDLKAIKFKFEKEQLPSKEHIKANFEKLITHKKVEKWPLPKRLSNMKFNQQIGSEIWHTVLRWNNLSHDQALQIIDEYDAKQNNLHQNP